MLGKKLKVRIPHPTIKITRKDGTVEYHKPKAVYVMNKDKFDAFIKREQQRQKEKKNG